MGVAVTESMLQNALVTSTLSSSLSTVMRVTPSLGAENSHRPHCTLPERTTWNTGSLARRRGRLVRRRGRLARRRGHLARRRGHLAKRCGGLARPRLGLKTVSTLPFLRPPPPAPVVSALCEALLPALLDSSVRSLPCFWKDVCASLEAGLSVCWALLVRGFQYDSRICDSPK